MCLGGAVGEKDFAKIKDKIKDFSGGQIEQRVPDEIPTDDVGDIPFQMMCSKYNSDEQGFTCHFNANLSKEEKKVKDFIRFLEKIDEDWSDDLLEKIRTQHLSKQCRNYKNIFVRVDMSLPKESTNQKTFEDIDQKLKDISDFLLDVEDLIEISSGYVCNSYYYPEEEYALELGLNDPNDIYISSETSETIGRPQLTGLHLDLDFMDSRSGLKKGEISYMDGHYWIGLEKKCDVHDLSSLILDNLVLSDRLNKTFVKRS